jgi:hypothetical protein
MAVFVSRFGQIRRKQELEEKNGQNAGPVLILLK